MWLSSSLWARIEVHNSTKLFGDNFMVWGAVLNLKGLTPFSHPAPQSCLAQSTHPSVPPPPLTPVQPPPWVDLDPSQPYLSSSPPNPTLSLNIFLLNAWAPPPLLSSLSPSWLLRKPTNRLSFESNSADVSGLCFLFFCVAFFSLAFWVQKSTKLSQSFFRQFACCFCFLNFFQHCIAVCHQVSKFFISRGNTELLAPVICFLLRKKCLFNSLVHFSCQSHICCQSFLLRKKNKSQVEKHCSRIIFYLKIFSFYELPVNGLKNC